MNDRTPPTKDTKTAIEYNRSPLPPEAAGGFSRPSPDRAIGTDERGNWQYPSAAASGHVEVELPSLPGSPTAVERLHARDFGMHVLGKIEGAMTRPGYLKSGATQGPSEVLSHYAASARGAGLLDKTTTDELTRLSREFQSVQAKERPAYYESMVKPFLLGLTPQRRG